MERPRLARSLCSEPAESCLGTGFYWDWWLREKSFLFPKQAAKPSIDQAVLSGAFIRSKTSDENVSCPTCLARNLSLGAPKPEIMSSIKHQLCVVLI